MNKGTKWLIIIISIIALVLAGLYVKYELPRRAGIQGDFSNLSISAMYEGKYIEAVLVIENGESKEISTRKGYEFMQIKKGIYNIYNKNSSEVFYRTIKEYNITKDILRIDFKLSKPKEVKLKSKNNGSRINLEISSENYQNVKLCIKHSINYIFVEFELEKIDLLDGYEDWSKCYSLDRSIKGVEFLNVSYQIFGTPTEDDYIKVAVIDTDYIDGKHENELDGVDLGGEDLIRRIK